ncbi:signal peptidase I [bacterium]|nr:signal peptidase I [bacterium]
MAGSAGGSGPANVRRARRPRDRYALLAVVVCLFIVACLVGGAALVSRRPAFALPCLASYRVSSATMEPTYRAGQTVITVRGYYVVHPPQFGDVVIVRKADESPRPFLKRIVGVPGDRLKVSGGRLWRSGQAVDEPYIKEPMAYTWPASGEVTVPPGTVAALGDNRNDSNDSHLWSPPCVPVSDLVAKVVAWR